MPIDKGLLSGSTTTLILKLLDEKDMYGYEMIESLAEKSCDTFSLKAGTLYPILHNLEKKGFLESYEEKVGKERVRKYYRITKTGKGLLQEKQSEWNNFSNAVNMVLNGGANYATT